MGVFSFLNKNKQDGESAKPAFGSRNDADAEAGRGRARERKARATNAPADDPLLPEKKRARRRLLGAIALVIAVVIGLPMVLDPEPKPLAEDIAIQIPSRDKPSAAPARSPAAVTAAPTLAASLDQKEEIVVPDKPAPKVAKAAAAKEELVEPVEAPAPPVKPAEKTVVKAQPAHAPAVDEAARANAILEGKADTRAAPEKAKADSGSGKIVLQVAALATQEKITEVQNKLKSVGINSYTQKISTESGPRTRIRVIAANQEEADRLRAKMTKVSLNAQAVSSGH
jgi:DedD protein